MKGIRRSTRWVRRLNRVLAAGALVPLGWSAQANTGTSSIRQRPQEVNTDKNRRVWRGELRVESMQYFTEVPETPDLTRSQFLSAELRGEGSWNSAIGYRLDASAGTFFRRSQSDIAVKEAHLGGRIGSRLSWQLGRRHEVWSELDSRWQLGLWQPKFAIDALRSQEQGLTGLFAHLEQPSFRLSGFVTPVFVPTMGPSIREEGGALVSDSRWYRQPSSNYSFSNRLNTISYRLDIPEMWRLVGNPGSGLAARWGREDRGAWARAGWAYKPVNELLLKRQNFKAVSEDRVDVTVSPDVTYHRVTSTDVGYRFSDVGASVSYVEDDPFEKRPDPEWTIQKLKPLRAYSAQLDWDLHKIFSRTLRLRLDYLKVEGGGIEDIQSDGSGDDFTLFDHRTQFTDAVSLSLEGDLGRVRNRPLVGRWRYLYDGDQMGSMINTEVQYSPAQQWAVVVGADILGVEDESKRPSGFLNQFRANDRFYGGMTYVF